MEFLSDVSGTDQNVPSLFEIVSEEELSALIKPAVRYIIAVNYPAHKSTADMQGSTMHSDIRDTLYGSLTILKKLTHVCSV